MPRDYKDRVPGAWRRPARRRRNDWLWVVPVVLVGAAAIAVFRFGSADKKPAEANSRSTRAESTTSTPGDRHSAAPADPAEGKKGKAAGKEKDATKTTKEKKADKSEKIPEIQLPEPRFTFYKILPEKEVIVSDSEIRNLARDEKAGKTGASGSYVIQAGSFGKLEDAEKLKARLAEVKVKAKLEKVLIENATWYRVKIGPYNSLMEAEQMRAHLRMNKVDSVLQQTKSTK